MLNLRRARAAQSFKLDIQILATASMASIGSGTASGGEIPVEKRRKNGYASRQTEDFTGRHHLHPGRVRSRFVCMFLCITTVYSPRPGTRFHKQNTLSISKYARFSITVKTLKTQRSYKNNKKTPTKNKYANPKNKMEVQAHDNNEYAVQQQGTEYRTISKDKTHSKMLKTSENNNIKTNEGRVKGDLRIRCQNRTRSAHTHVLCTQNAKTSTPKSKRTVSAVQSRTQLLAHIECKHELSAAHQL